MKTCIQLTDDWRITADKYQWILQHKKILTNRETKELYDSWQPEAYYPTIGQAVNECFQRGLRLSGAQTLGELEEYAKDLSITLTNALKPIVSVDLSNMGGRAA